MTRQTPIVILAGGRATRLGGGDKCRQRIGDRTVIDRILACLRPQAIHLALNANGDPARFADLGLPVLPDPMPGQPGPLAGILAGLGWAERLGAAWLVSVPADCPFLPPDLVLRLHQARDAAASAYACAASGGRTHPVAALWPISCRGALRAALLAGQHRVSAFTALHKTATAEWPASPVDPFLNVNTPADLARALETARRC